MATLVATVLGSGAVICEARAGRNHAFNKLDSKLDGIDSKPDRTSTSKLDETKDDPGAEIQCAQSMVVETALHTMRAIDGDKKTSRSAAVGEKR
jgi:hypothetical protein